MNPHDISSSAYLFHQCGRVFDLFQFQVGRDDQRLPAPVPAVNDKEHLLQRIFSIAFHSQVVQDQKAVMSRAEIKAARSSANIPVSRFSTKGIFVISTGMSCSIRALAIHPVKKVILVDLILRLLWSSRGQHPAHETRFLAVGKTLPFRFYGLHPLQSAGGRPHSQPHGLCRAGRHHKQRNKPTAKNGYFRQ